MKRVTTAIYTVYSSHYNMHEECRAMFIRDRYLTEAGCQRLIRKGEGVSFPRKTANVIRVEYALWGN